jgi:hypothetical protein
MPQYLISVWHDDTYETDFSAPDAQRRVAQVGAFNEELIKAGSPPACSPRHRPRSCGLPEGRCR